MPQRIPAPRTDMCQLCYSLLSRKLPLRQSFRPQRSSSRCAALASTRSFTTARRRFAKEPQNAHSKGSKPSSRKVEAAQIQAPKHLTQQELEKVLQEVTTTCTDLLSSGRLPSERETMRALGLCNTLVDLLVHERPSDIIDGKEGAALALLDLDDSRGKKKIPTNQLPQAIQRTMNEISRVANAIITHPHVFITPEILFIYTKIQADLGKPETFPEVFRMYANKPIPQEGFPTKFSKQNSNKVANAVKKAVADRALQAAIDAKQLVAAMDIVDSTYNTTAYYRYKLVTKCLVPAAGITLAPLAAYTVACQLAGWQTTMEPVMATNVAFAGILAYTFFTGTIGVVAITTANDQMDRVTWAPGIPLRERWMREEERAAMDKVAVAWGFRETWRRGEEEGEDWDALREWIGLKGMILDRVELMEGME